MKNLKRFTALLVSMTLSLSLAIFPVSAAETASTTTISTTDLSKLVFNNSKWNYDATNDVYWQIGVEYCATPEAIDYETLGIYVPGAYMTAKANSDGTFTCVINNTGKVGEYTAKTAPIVIPVNTPGYSAMTSPTSYSYSGIANYMKAGFIYVYAGCRGRDNGTDTSGNVTYSGGAPWGVTDLKAAIRYIRYNKNVLAGDTEKIFTFGMSGGGAQSALVGATGNSALYTPYLKSIGAAIVDDNGNAISDAVLGSMAWCPITSLDYADEAYEWFMGQYATTGTRADGTFTSVLSDDMAKEFATYINQLGLKDENGVALTLSTSTTGIYNSGSYYNYLLSEIERSLNNFLRDTTFPYTSGASDNKADGGFVGPDGATGGGMPTGGAPTGTRGAMPTKTATVAVTYKTVQEYINSLNTGEAWIKYDAKTNTAKITSIEAFITHCKNASKDVGAFDDLNRSAGENAVFGDNKTNALHFDETMAKLLNANQATYSTFSEWKDTYVKAYQEYLTSVDALGNSSLARQNMYNPMYYLSNAYEGFETSTPATYWRIRTGIDQGDTALTIETNLALALESYKGVKDVDFETVWGLQHTMAERTGNSTDNFIEWVKECLASTKTADSITINGNKITLSSPIVNVKGTDFYPLRESLERAGASVEWVEQTKTVKATLGKNTVSFKIDSNTYYVNGEAKQMDNVLTALMNNNKAYIPIKYAAEALGFTAN